MTRHAEVANSDGGAQRAAGAGRRRRLDRRPRRCAHRGTIGGSIANNDPNADYPAACLGLGATIITNKRQHCRPTISSPGMFSTALEEGEIIVKVSFPIAKKAGV